MPRAIFLVGLPASGKSTYVQNFLDSVAEDAQLPLVLSSDNILMNWADDAGISYQDAYVKWAPQAQEEVLSMAAYAADAGIDVVWDQTNLTRDQRADRMDIFPDTTTFIAVAFEAPDDILADRLEQAGKDIPQHILDGMKAAYERPDHDEGFENVVLITPSGTKVL
jgi:predicted kinase